MIRILLVAAFAAVLPSCTAVRSLQDSAQKIGAVVGEWRDASKDAVEKVRAIGQTIAAVPAELKAELAAHKAAADKNGDGKTDPREWLEYGLAILGVGGGGVIMARNAKSDRRKSEAEARIAQQEQELAELRGRLFTMGAPLWAPPPGNPPASAGGP